MRPPRRLSSDEVLVWRAVTQTVTPLTRKKVEDLVLPPTDHGAGTHAPPRRTPGLSKTPAKVRAAPCDARPAPEARSVPPSCAGERRVGLDGSWERKISRGGLEPDFSLDLHGATLDQAYSRLMHGLAQARAMGARVMLVVTGKPRPSEAADRGSARGAIRAKIIDWLRASEHANAIAAVRGAHRRHGGHGAVYVVLKRGR